MGRRSATYLAPCSPCPLQRGCPWCVSPQHWTHTRRSRCSRRLQGCPRQAAATCVRRKKPQELGRGELAGRGETGEIMLVRWPGGMLQGVLGGQVGGV